MLQTMRKGAQGVAAKIIIGLIVFAFAAFGLESLLPGGSGSSVAEVNGEEISPFALDEAVTRQKRQLLSILGDQIDPAMLDDARLRPRALEALIQRALLLQRSQLLGLVASAEQVGKSITSVEAFQLNGEFSPDAYKSVLANNGYSPERFRRAQTEDIVLTQIQTAVTETEFVTATELEAMANIAAEERDVRYLLVSQQALLSEDDLSEEALRNFYFNNEGLFFRPERAIVDYILLERDAFLGPVDETVVEQQFATVEQEYQTTDQARVSHILLIQREEENAMAFSARVALVDERIRAGEDFAELAVELSDDLGSAAIGGGLGFTDGSAFPEPMELAIANLAAPGDVSGAVETDAGTHFIRLEERVVSAPPDYDQIREELRESIQQSEADRQLLLAVESLRDLVFTAPDLATPADEIGAALLESNPFSEAEGEGIFADARLRALAFSDDVKTNGNNSEVIELSSGRFVALRLKELKPAQVAPYTEVSSEVERRLRAELEANGVDALRAEAESLLAAGTNMEAVAQALELDWRVELAASKLSSLLPRPILEAAFTMPDGSPSDLAVVRTEDGYALVQLARVTAGTLDNLTTAEAQNIRARRASDQQQLQFDEFMLFQRDSADIVIR